MVSVREAIEALQKVVDPELGSNIVDIGLIYNIAVKEGKEVKVTLTMTSPMCPVTSIIMADAQLRLEAIPGVSKVDLDLVWDPMWSPEMMDESLKYTS